MEAARLSENEIFALERPRPSLFTYYALSSLLLGPFFFFALIPLYFRYHTLRYRFDDEGVSMRWGVLFRREIHLTYARIQDIHLMSNVVERWLGLARIKIQTASGSAKAEMTIEGIEAFEDLRDFLYARMRGTRAVPGSPGPDRGEAPAASGTAGPSARAPVLDPAAELAATLRQVAAELKALRLALEEQQSDAAGEETAND
jgi:putative membrane protein